MKKKLFIGLITLAVMVIGVFLVAFMRANSIAAHYKPAIEKSVGDALGGKVTFGAIEVSIFPKVRLSVDETSIVSSKDESESLVLANLEIWVKLLPLLQGDLQIISLSLDKPSVSVIREVNGIRIAGIQLAKA
ncbi:AsmA family protein, partial [Candidatus Hydrogenedentota bacterium]